MCNLYSVQSSAAEIAVHFGVSDPPAFEIPGQIKQDGIKRGEPGIIVRQSAGRRVMQSLRWGFPRPQADRDGKPATSSGPQRLDHHMRSDHSLTWRSASSFAMPYRSCMRPTSWSCLPWMTVRSSLVSLPHCSLMLPMTCFRLPSTRSQFMYLSSRM